MRNQINFIIAGMVLATSAWAHPPATPSLFISPDGPKVHLYWNEVAEADSYTLFASRLTDGSLLGEYDMGNTNRITVMLPVGTGYYVSVRAENSEGVSPYSTPQRLVVSADTNLPTPQMVIQNYAGNVVYNTYRDLADQAKKLNAAIVQLRLEPSDELLAIAQQHWVETRRPWEQSEAFLFGPVDTAGLDPAMDSWPVNAVDLQNVLDSDTALNVEAVSAFNDDLKGFHVIEFLLFGANSNKTSGEFTERELMYLGAAAGALVQDTQSLAQGWSPSEGNFLAEFAQAGAGSSTYTSESSALQEIVNGLIGIAGELASVKLEEPQRIGDATLAESQFSLNSRADFMDNVRGIRNAYTGNYLLSEGPGLNAWVRSIDPDLDETINNQIEAAIAAIDAIPQPFVDSILSAEVQEAINAVNALLVTLSNRLSAVIP